jgi:hypothetical protein
MLSVVLVQHHGRGLRAGGDAPRCARRAVLRSARVNEYAPFSGRPDPQGALPISPVDREREVAGGIVSGALSLTRVGKKGGVAMRQKLHWLDYDPVAFAVLAIGMAMIGLFALLI